jgi:hypothetical protein
VAGGCELQMADRLWQIVQGVGPESEIDIKQNENENENENICFGVGL